MTTAVACAVGTYFGQIQLRSLHAKFLSLLTAGCAFAFALTTFLYVASFRVNKNDKSKKKKKMNEQVFVTTSDAKTIKAISVDLETFVVSDVLSSLMGDSDDGRNLEGINLRSTRTGQMFPISFSKNNNHHLQSSFTPSLRQLGVQNNDHFILQVSLLGGGGDGGGDGGGFGGGLGGGLGGGGFGGGLGG